MLGKKALKQLANLASAASSSSPTGLAVKTTGRRRRRNRTPGYNLQRTAPVAYTNPVDMAIPRFSGKGSTISVSHREFVGEVVSYAAFEIVVTKPINPGLHDSFPWLSGIAQNFESYTVRKLRYSYIPVCATQVGGSVMLAVDYDAKDAPPERKADMLAYASAKMTQPWAATYVDCNPSDLVKFAAQRYKRIGAAPSGTDLRNYDVGNVYVAVDGFAIADGTVVGNVFVDYVVEFQTPDRVTDLEVANSKRINAVTGVAKATPFGTAPALSGDLPVTIETDLIRFNKTGEFLLDMLTAGTGLLAGDPTLTGTATSKVSAAHLPNGAATAGRVVLQALIDEIGQTVKVDFTPISTTTTAVDTRISPFSYHM